MVVADTPGMSSARFFLGEGRACTFWGRLLSHLGGVDVLLHVAHDAVGTDHLNADALRRVVHGQVRAAQHLHLVPSERLQQQTQSTLHDDSENTLRHNKLAHSVRVGHGTDLKGMECSRSP